MNLDTTFLAQVMTVIGFAVGLSLLLASARYPDHIRRSLRAFAYGKFLIGCAFLIGAVRMDTLPGLLVPLANGLTVSGIAMNLLSVRHLRNAPLSRPWRLAPALLGVAMAGVCALAMLVGPPDLSMVRLLSSVAVIALVLALAADLLFGFDERGVAHYSTGILMLVIVGALVARIVVALDASGDPGHRMADDGVERLAFIIGLMASVVVTINYVLMASDEFNKELTKLAHTDGLTGALNRRRFFELGEQEFRRARRHHRALTVLIIDIDRFKAINDRAGHPFGDRVIRAVADSCARQIRQEDRVARLGGEEFALLLPDTSVEDGWHLAERLRARIEDEVGRLGAERGMVVTCSIGGVSLRADHAAFDDLIAQSDHALYEAKNGGRNQVRFTAEAPAPVALPA